jgi:hypothetical protein
VADDAATDAGRDEDDESKGPPSHVEEQLLDAYAARAMMADTMAALAAEQARLDAYASKVQQEMAKPWKAKTPGVNAQDKPLSAEEQALINVSTEDSSYNAPMLVSFLFKVADQEPTIVKGLKAILHHMESGEGCRLLHTNGIIVTIIKIHHEHPKHTEIQLLCATALRCLVDCNLTRDAVIDKTDVLQVAFAISHTFMTSQEHVEQVCRCIAQCARSEVCRLYILRHNIPSYMTNYCRAFSRSAPILRYTLKVFNWVSTTPARLDYLLKINAVGTTLQCMKRHITNADVLAPAMLLLTRMASQVPEAMEVILKKKAVSTVINALKALYAHDVLQLEGLLMIQALSKTREGWQQISDTRGGWQSICQGTTQGDALMHDLPGAFQNPGWCIGETPHLPMVERYKLLAAKAAQTKARGGPKAHWTVTSLREFMGMTMKATKLAINNERPEVHFELLQTLDLLPKPGEEKEKWFVRIGEYEKESEIRLEDMIDTVIEMKHKEQKQAKEAANATASQDYIKPGKEVVCVYVYICVYMYVSVRLSYDIYVCAMPWRILLQCMRVASASPRSIWN